MKFLCISCDEQRKLVKTDKELKPDAKGSLSRRYECPDCLIEIAMLTNPFETQLVTSLGVEIGGETVKETGGSTVQETESKCPFSKTARDAMVNSGVEAPGAIGSPQSAGEMKWTAQAAVRLQNIPEFVRAYAKTGIEKYAVDQGFNQVNEKLLDAAKEHFDM